MTEIRFTGQALENATPAQIDALGRVASPDTVEFVFAANAGLGFPDGYLSIAIHYRNGDRSPIYGGIDPDGERLDVTGFSGLIFLVIKLSGACQVFEDLSGWCWTFTWSVPW